MAGHKGSPYYDIFLNYEIWLETIEKTTVLDGEGFSLLLEIEKTRSLATAARNLGISYRKAWGLLGSIEKHLGFNLVERTRGGAAGGSTDLTTEGRKLLVSYKNLHYETDVAMKSIAKVFFNRINEIPEKR